MVRGDHSESSFVHYSTCADSGGFESPTSRTNTPESGHNSTAPGAEVTVSRGGATGPVAMNLAFAVRGNGRVYFADVRGATPLPIPMRNEWTGVK